MTRRGPGGIYRRFDFTPYRRRLPILRRAVPFGPTLGPYALAVQASNPVAWYRLSGNYSDSMGGLGGSTTGSPSFVSGLPLADSSQALSLPGTAYVEVPAQTQINLTTDFTIELVFSATAPADNLTHVLVAKGGAVGADYWHLEVRKSATTGLLNPYFTVVQAGSGHSLSTTDPVNANEVHHLAATYTGGAPTIYLDGVATSTTGWTDPVAMDLPLTIGASVKAAARSQYAGVIDEVALYNTVLSGATIAAHAALVGYKWGALALVASASAVFGGIVPTGLITPTATAALALAPAHTVPAALSVSATTSTSLSGVSTISGVLSPSAVASAALVGLPVHPGVLTPAATGSLALVQAQTEPGALAPTGAASLALVQAQTEPGVLTPTGTASLALFGAPRFLFSSLPVTAAASLALVQAQTEFGVLTPTAAAALALVQSQTEPGALAPTGTASLTLVSIGTNGLIRPTAVATLALAPTVTRFGVLTPTAAAALLLAGVQGQPGALAFTAHASWTETLYLYVTVHQATGTIVELVAVGTVTDGRVLAVLTDRAVAAGITPALVLAVLTDRAVAAGVTPDATSATLNEALVTGVVTT